MVVKSPYPDIPIPEVDLLTYLFSDGKKLSDEPIWVNSADSSQFLSLQSVLPWIKRLGLGLQKLGLNPGDVVMLVSPNHIFVPVAYLGVAGFGFIFSGASPMFTVDGKFEGPLFAQSLGSMLVIFERTANGGANFGCQDRFFGLVSSFFRLRVLLAKLKQSMLISSSRISLSNKEQRCSHRPRVPDAALDHPKSSQASWFA